jgi:uncharacterized protein YceH (UPF0502 family)
MSAAFGSNSRIQGLSAAEVRVLGCLLEKQRTTPDQYPLSLNALRLACNQSTNRDPVVEYDEATLRDALHRLERRGLVRLASGAGSRAAKYRHLLAEALPLGEGEQAILTVLMLRGPQTPGELKQRSERMYAFAELSGVHESLERLIERGLVVRLDRRPGQKEERYSQLLQDDEAGVADAEIAPSGAIGRLSDTPAGEGGEGGEGAESGAGDGAGESGGGEWATPPSQQLDRLSERIARLEREVAELRAGMRNASPSAPSLPSREIDDPRRSDPRL